jgi:ketosteroid isomerase-like protein
MSSQGAGVVRILDHAIVQELERHWEEGWNRGDVDTIMAPFAPDIVFRSPGISMLSGDPAAMTIKGYDALRSYIAGALRRTPGIRYSLRATYVGTDSVVLVYACGLPDGTEKPGADQMRISRDRKVVEWRCHY